MKIFVAGATGALGRALVPLLVAHGHEVVGMTRSTSKQDLLRSLGARPVRKRRFRIVGGGGDAHDDRGAWRLGREGQARAGLAAALRDLAGGVREGT